MNGQSSFDWGGPADQPRVPEPRSDPAALPTPPLRLRRVHLRGVGPEGARFDPLDLDFTTRAGAASRVLLSLTNTGGKSTLITLVSSLVVPAARAQVGGKNLGDYVLTGDTSHVVCEWEDASTQARTVTGTVMEWKDGRRQPGHRQRSTTGLHRAWYLFPVQSGGPAIDELPFLTAVGRRTTFDAFVRDLGDTLSARTDSPYVITRTQQEWTDALERRTSIDPVLFGYQMRMNDSESGAQKLLAAFDSPDNVVRFFIGALNDDRELADFTGRLGPYADLAVQRPRLEALAAFGEILGPRIAAVADATDRAETAEQAARRARTAGGEHAASLDNRVAEDEARLVELDQAAREAAEITARARREYGQISDIRLQLQLEEARARLRVAQEAVTRTAAAASAAAKFAAAWDAVDLVVDVAKARTERDAAQKAYNVADAGLEPLRAAKEAAAAALAGRLDGLVAEAEAVALAADARAEEAEQQGRDAADRRRQAEADLGDARRDLAGIDATVKAADAARAAAVEDGWLLSGERPDRCERRWSERRTAHDAEADRQDALATAAEETFDALGMTIEAIDRDLVGQRAAADHARRRLAAFDAELAALAADETVFGLLGDVPNGSAAVGRAASLAAPAAAAADARAAEQERQATAAQDELSHLDETGMAPAGSDVLAVVTALTGDGFGAVTGLHWIEHNVLDPADRPAFIASHADLAGGVVVADPSRFDAAVAHLAERDLSTRTPVTLLTAPTATAPDTPGERRHVVIPYRATWDRAWAAASRERLAELALSATSGAEAARTAAAAYRAAAAVCTAFTTRWPAVSRSDLAGEADVTSQAVATAEEKRKDVERERAQARAQAAEARRRRDDERRAAADATRHSQAAAALAEQTGRAAAEADRRPGVENARLRADREVQAAEQDAEAATRAVKDAFRRASDARANRGPWLRERAGLGVEVAAADPGGNLEMIRGSWVSLREELAAAERGMVEAEALNRAQRRLGEVTTRLDRHDQDAVRAARELAATMEASSPELRADAQRRARVEAGDAETARLRAASEQASARDAERAARPAERLNHVDLSTVPEWQPESPAAIPEILARLEVRNAELLARRERAEAAERDAQELHDLTAADVTALADIAVSWTLERPPTVSAFTGTKDVARARMRELIEAHRSAEREENIARQAVRDAVTDARGLAGDARWRDLDAPLAVRVRSLRDNELIAEARTLAPRVTAMTGSARADLENLDTHRTLLRDSLVSLCRDQRRLLREITRSSRLPPGLGDLSAQPAIKIRFDEAPGDLAIARLASRIDEWAGELATNPKRASSPEVRARWLADAVRDTVVEKPRVGAWSIDILKPRIDGRVMYCPPDRIPHEFSGGQVLTLAVLIYCALSGVRSAHRVGGARPPGTLILDNPFGAASAEALIEMQHRLAAHTGLQLVCATGLNDAGVDAAFTGPGSVIVKLRNDGDLRRNLSFLRLRASVVDGVDLAAAVAGGRDPGSARNWVDGTSYEIRR